MNTIFSNVVIGCEGLYALRDNKGNLSSIRHVGKTKIGNFVEIGANSTICSGTIDYTKIGNYVLIGPQVNIGHNVIVKDRTSIAGKSQINGSVIISNNCSIWSSVVIKNDVLVGSYSTIGMGSIVTKNIKRNSIISCLNSMQIKDLVKLKKRIKYD